MFPNSHKTFYDFKKKQQQQLYVHVIIKNPPSWFNVTHFIHTHARVWMKCVTFFRSSVSVNSHLTRCSYSVLPAEGVLQVGQFEEPRFPSPPVKAALRIAFLIWFDNFDFAQVSEDKNKIKFRERQ